MSQAPAFWRDDMPDLIAGRHPFPDVEKWHSTYVRYKFGDEAQPGSTWDLEASKESLADVLGRESCVKEQNSVFGSGAPESITMRLVEAPAEFAAPVKQDRRLTPCFKVRVEVKHRGNVSLPLTLRAHVLNQQDKDDIARWMPAQGRDDESDREDKRSVTALKGTTEVAHVFESGGMEPSQRQGSASAKLSAPAGGNVSPFGTSNGVLLGGNGGGGGVMRGPGGNPVLGLPPALEELGTIVKSEAYYANGAADLGMGSSGGQYSSLQHGGGMSARGLDQGDNGGYTIIIDNGNGGRTELGGMSALSGLSGVNLAGQPLFSAARSEPAVTLAGARCSGTGAGGHGQMSGGGGHGQGGAVRLGNTEPWEFYDRIMSGQQGGGQQQQGRGRVVGSSGLDLAPPGSTEAQLLLNQRQKQLQLQLLQHHEQGGGNEGGGGGGRMGDGRQGGQGGGGSGSDSGYRDEQGGELHVLTHDFEFTNLELLKPTRMNKIYLAFAATVFDTDLIFTIFNVPTIGICRAEQREKACKKLNIEYRLLTHFEHSHNQHNVVHKPLLAPMGSGSIGGSMGMGSLGIPGLSAKRLESMEAKLMGHNSSQSHSQQQQQHHQHQQQHHHAQQHQQHQVELIKGMAAAQVMGGGGLGGQGMGGGGGGSGDLYYSPSMSGGGPMGGGVAQLRGGLSAAALNGGNLGASVPGWGIPDLGQGGSMLPPGASLASRKRDAGPTLDDIHCRAFAPMQHQIQQQQHHQQGGQGGAFEYQAFSGLTSADVDMLMPAPHSRMAMRDFINDVYESTGLNRKLTHMDFQALLSQAGFPMDSNREHDTISQRQWDEFTAQFQRIVNTLQQVASVWNLEDPVVISGFDMDRAGTISALANEPAGTFICRFSMSQPGCLVLTCKSPAHPKADGMGLIHAIIKIDDLHERRVDTWIRDYAGASHLLDVYRQKRVDKRKVFATNYTRLRGLEDVVEGVQLVGPGVAVVGLGGQGMGMGDHGGGGLMM